MILAGEAAGVFAGEQGIPLLYSVQEAPDSVPPHETLSEMFAMRRVMRRSQYRVAPGAHHGLGLPHYTQATSPLRRYLDLVTHQQLRAALRKAQPLGESDLLERIGMVEALIPALRQAEQNSEKHWTLVYLRRHPDWVGEAVLVDRRGAQGTWLIPDLALEGRASAPATVDLDSRLPVRVHGIDLPALSHSLNILW